MTFALPELETFCALPWQDIQPYVDELQMRALSPEIIDAWLLDWTALQELLQERGTRVRIAAVQDTTDAAAEQAHKDFLDEIFGPMRRSGQALTEKLLAYVDTHGEPEGLHVPLRNMIVDAQIYREENLALQSAEQENAVRFNKIVGAQTVTWEAEDQTITQLATKYDAADRDERLQMWDLVTAREMADRDAINGLWAEVLDLRLQQAANAGFPGDYRAFRWQLLHRFDYTPDDSKTFQDAIEKTAVPAAGRIYEKYRRRFGVDSIRPWDLDLYQQTYPINPAVIRAFTDEDDLLNRARTVFNRVDPRIGRYFERMCADGVIDFANRKGKGPGAFCASFESTRSPFIFGNVVGKADDVRTLLHEAGHAFHAFETYALPYYQQRWPPMEFNEVASTAMELLASPYLGADQGGYFNEPDGARSRARHLEKLLLFWPYMAVVDAFQHWVYENPEQARRAANCDAAWSDCWDRFIPWVDWSGVEDAKALGWHRKRHIHRSPFYYIEYGLAQLGAVQIWARALEDQSAAVGSYLEALSLGATVTLPELYETAGGKFAFDVETVGAAVGLVERELVNIESGEA